MQDWEKKMNKIFLDFIIGGSYLGDRAQDLHDRLKKVGIAMYEHLMMQWEIIKKRREED